MRLRWPPWTAAAACGPRSPRTATQRPVSILAIGKAAAAMTLGALDALGARRGARAGRRAGRRDCPRTRARSPHISCLAGDHPVPGERSLAAGAAALEFAAATPAGSRVLLLVSGGASALLEVPPPGVTLAELQRSSISGPVRGDRHRDAERERARCRWSRPAGCRALFRDCERRGPDDLGRAAATIRRWSAQGCWRARCRHHAGRLPR